MTAPPRRRAAKARARSAARYAHVLQRRATHLVLMGGRVAPGEDHRALADPHLRAQLEDIGLGYVLAIGCDRRAWTDGGLLRSDAQ